MRTPVDEYLTSQELEKMLNISHKFIEKHLGTRRIPGAVKVGGRWRFSRAIVEKRLEAGELLLPKKEPTQ